MKKKITNEYRKFSEFSFPVAPDLAKITQKCLQTVKENRYNSAVSLLAELEAVQKSISADEPEKLLRTYLSNPEQFRDTLQCLDMQLSEEERTAITALSIDPPSATDRESMDAMKKRGW